METISPADITSAEITIAINFFIARKLKGIMINRIEINLIYL